MTFATLRALHAVIGAAIDDIERVYTQHSQDDPVNYPSLDEPYYSTAQHPPEEDLAESLKGDPTVVAASMSIVGACAQLSATVNKPWTRLMTDMLWGEFSSAIRLLEAANIVEILREAGPGGLHVQEIHRLALKLRTNSKTAAPPEMVSLTPARLGRILRLLATGHYLREVHPDVFANNRASSYIDSGKTVAQLRETPEKKYNDTDGVAAYVGILGDEVLKCTAYMTDWVLPERHAAVVAAHTVVPSDRAVNSPTRYAAPLNVAFNTPLGYFPWLELPENSGRLARFGQGMVGARQFESKNQILHGFSWADLPQGAVLVDVGGGIGSQSILVAQAHPHIRVVVEDREQVVSTARSAWGPQYSHLFEYGRVSWRTRDFFDAWPALAMPILGCADAPGPVVFLLRMVLHNWNDEDSRKILSQLRAAAGPQTKLLLGEVLLDNTCANKTEYGTSTDAAGAAMTVPSATPKDSDSSPLLPNLGVANTLGHLVDILMMGLYGANERTMDEMTALTLSAGWKIVEVRCSPGSIVGYTTAIPV
ncbi:hypothetical protein V8D89_001353 [Ganoderma adspersum]